MLGINLFLYKNTKVSLLQNCPSFNDYVILCAAARVNTLRVSSLTILYLTLSMLIHPFEKNLFFNSPL